MARGAGDLRQVDAGFREDRRQRERRCRCRSRCRAAAGSGRSRRMTSSRLRVGACTTAAVPAKETTATLTLRGSSATKALAASCAATSRFGWTSAARMLPETSIARTIVSCADGRVISAAGRDEREQQRASASSSSAGGTWRRQALRLPIASLAPGRGWRSAGVVFLRRVHQDRRRARPAPAAASIAHSMSGQRKVIQGEAGVLIARLALPAPARRSHVGDRAAGRPAPVGEPAALLLQVGKAQDRVDQVVVGARARACRRRRGRAPRAAPSRAARRRRRSARGSRGRGCRRRAARRSRRRCIVTRPMSGRSISSGSNRRTAVTSWRCASWPSARSQPGALMKSETTKTRRAALDHALRRRAAARAGRSRRPALSAGRAAIRCSRLRTWTRPPRAGSTVSTSLP